MSDPIIDRDRIETAAQYLRNARSAIALTGAGISTPSGIPDFRSEKIGLWAQDDPLDVASLTVFRRNPERFFNWIRGLGTHISNAHPNEAHWALARLEQAGHLKAVVTQNIDGLHQQAGSQRVIELHGSLRTYSCPAGCGIYPADEIQPAFLQEGILPQCPHCQKFLKPDIILFEEMLPTMVWEEAVDLCSHADLMIIIGSSLAVNPAAQLPFYALDRGARLIIINRTQTPIDRFADLIFRRDLAEVVPELANRV